MLRPTPASILVHSGVVRVPSSTDDYGKPVYDPDIAINFVNLQPTNAIKRSKENREVVLSSLLFFDCQLSEPLGLNWDNLFEQAASAAGKIEIEITHPEGSKQAFKVETVEALRAPDGSLHHYEIGLV